MVETIHFMSYISLALSAYIGWHVVRREEKFEKMWSTHTQKELETVDIHALKKKFYEHEKSFLEFKITTEIHNKHILEALTKLARDIEHKEKGTSQGFNNITKDLGRIKHKLDIE